MIIGATSTRFRAQPQPKMILKTSWMRKTVLRLLIEKESSDSLLLELMMAFSLANFVASSSRILKHSHHILMNTMQWLPLDKLPYSRLKRRTSQVVIEVVVEELLQALISTSIMQISF